MGQRLDLLIFWSEILIFEMKIDNLFNFWSKKQKKIIYKLEKRWKTAENKRTLETTRECVKARDADMRNVGVSYRVQFIFSTNFEYFSSLKIDFHPISAVFRHFFGLKIWKINKLRNSEFLKLGLEKFQIAIQVETWNFEKYKIPKIYNPETIKLKILMISFWNSPESEWNQILENFSFQKNWKFWKFGFSGIQRLLNLRNPKRFIRFWKMWKSIDL